MRALPVEVLHLHLSSRNLVTTGNRPVLTKSLHKAIYSYTVNTGETNTDIVPSSLPQLEQTVQSLMDKCLEGLESRLKPHCTRCCSPIPAQLLCQPHPLMLLTVSRMTIIFISLPSILGTPYHPPLHPPLPIDDTVQAPQLAAIPIVMEQMPVDVDTPA